MSIDLQNLRRFQQPDFPAPLEYSEYFYNVTLLQKKKIPFGFISDNLQKVKLI